MESRLSDEPMTGTASRVTRWLCLEQPGPWGKDAVRQSRLHAAVAQELATRSRELDVRVLLIRRPGRYTPRRRRCVIVYTGR